MRTQSRRRRSVRPDGTEGPPVSTLGTAHTSRRCRCVSTGRQTRCRSAAQAEVAARILFLASPRSRNAHPRPAQPRAEPPRRRHPPPCRQRGDPRGELWGSARCMLPAPSAEQGHSNQEGRIAKPEPGYWALDCEKPRESAHCEESQPSSSSTRAGGPTGTSSSPLPGAQRRREDSQPQGSLGERTGPEAPSSRTRPHAAPRGAGFR